jgi:cytochrome oxidase Cu insertion factor (SCO1/SenC/PrrC family)
MFPLVWLQHDRGIHLFLSPDVTTRPRPVTLPQMTSTPTRLAGLFTACALLAFAATVAAAKPAPPEKTGLAIGQKAPDFTLKDQNGRDVSLAVLLKKGPVALVFFRSAEW